MCQQFQKYDLADVGILFLGVGSCISAAARAARALGVFASRSSSHLCLQGSQVGVEATCPQDLSGPSDSLHENCLPSPLRRSLLMDGPQQEDGIVVSHC